VANKLEKSTYPAGHSAVDFTCFGPPAIKDGQFEGTMIADLGCFKQGEVDSNKGYHGAVVQSKKTNNWYAYFEWGRTGSTPTFQFVECGSKAEAEREYADQLHSKNDKRGEWVDLAGVGRVIRPKPGKDCYVVRPQATRSTGLPDARTIKSNDIPIKPKATSAKSLVNVDNETLKLLRDLNVGTVAYTKGQMTNEAIPTADAITQSRAILDAASKRIVSVGNNVDVQLADRDLLELTQHLFSLIPKKKARNAAPSDWLLTQTNIGTWRLDLDAFESALHSQDFGESQSDAFGGMRLKMSYVAPSSEIGRFIYNWMPNATTNRSMGRLQIHNIWAVEREGDIQKLLQAQTEITGQQWTTRERPLNQPKRIDLTSDEIKLFIRSHTAMLFHGTRSCNTIGILREGLRLPKELVGVITNGAM